MPGNNCRRNFHFQSLFGQSVSLFADRVDIVLFKVLEKRVVPQPLHIEPAGSETELLSHTLFKCEDCHLI